MLSEQYGLELKYNYRNIISFEGSNKILWIDFWNLKRKILIRDSLSKFAVATNETNILVSPSFNRLKILNI